MQIADKSLFEELLVMLCGAFDTPPTLPRRVAYWTAFELLPLAQVRQMLEAAVRGAFKKMPTTGELWALHYTLREAAKEPRLVIRQVTPLELLEYVIREYGSRLSQVQLSRPWEYFGNADGSQLAGVAIPADGNRSALTVRVADMVSL